ncbi:unnamed protein product [Linum tenue]|uniref:Uncharacterized protein n=1 Tax=Linum tenue TaxID=586396 RepID=A0AAV0H7K2_9ROSI|nr:unnamed protein product [Linum tenue]
MHCLLHLHHNGHCPPHLPLLLQGVLPVFASVALICSRFLSILLIKLSFLNSGSVSGFASPVHGPRTRPRDAFVPCPPASQSPDRPTGVSQTPVCSTKSDRKRSRKTTPRKAEAKSRPDEVSQAPVCSPKSDRKRSRKTTPRKAEPKSRESSPNRAHSIRRRRLVTHSGPVGAPAGPDVNIDDTGELDDPVSDQDGSPGLSQSVYKPYSRLQCCSKTSPCAVVS